MFTSFSEVEQALLPYIDYNSGLYTVDMTKKLAEFMGSPEQQLRVVHVAGTSGKTSTCYYVRELLQAAGQKTGLTVSPHIMTIADRVQVDGSPLSEAEFCRYFSEFYHKLQDFDGQPSYFEVMMVFALWVFWQEKVDYVVVETGLGGLHDSSNICRRNDKVCILTDIGFDHMAVLGETLHDIATQKVGIVAPGNKLLLYAQSEEIMAAITAVAKDILLVDELGTDDYRLRNFQLSLTAFSWLQKRDGLTRLTADQISSCSKVQVPGRLDIFNRSGKTVVLDGAHNHQKMTALIETFTHQFPNQKPIIILSMKQGKESQEVIGLLKSLASKIIATEYQTFQDTKLGAVSADELVLQCQKAGIAANKEGSLDLALARAETEGDLILVTGSLYAVSEVRRKLV